MDYDIGNIDDFYFKQLDIVIRQYSKFLFVLN